MKLYLRGKTWWVTSGSGKNHIRVSTGKSNKDEALVAAKQILAPTMMEDLADKIEVAATASAGLRQKAQNIRFSLSDTKIADIPSTYPYKNEYRALKTSSIDAANACWANFARFAEKRNIFLIRDVTPELANDFLASISGRKRMAMVSFQYCRRFCQLAGLDPNPFDHHPIISGESVHHQALTMDELRKLFDRADSYTRLKVAADSKEFAVFIRFLTYTGLRLGDAATAKVSDVDFSQTPSMLCRKMAKTSKMVRFPLHPSLVPLLPRNGEYLFPHIADSYIKVGHGNISLRIRRLFKAAGITGEASEYSAHSLRTTFATICAENHIPLAAIQSWLGHSSQMVTRIYTNLENDRRKIEALKSFPSLD